jgi:predicted nucleic acid-binding protein
MPRSGARKARSEAVIDTSCLACLLHLGLLGKLIYRYEIIRIPRRVWNEVYDWNEERRKQERKPGIYRLQNLLRHIPTSFKRCYVTDAYRVQLLTDHKQNPKTYIDRGEAETIVQANELQIRGHRISEVLMDDKDGTKVARAFGLNVRGTAGILALLERDRMITEKARVLIERCRKELKFHITDKIIEQTLKEYGVE